jgi:hypothetical protein
MRKTLWIIFALLFLAIEAPTAKADSYDAVFTCTTPCAFPPLALPVSGSDSGTFVDVFYLGFFFPIAIDLDVIDPYTPPYTWFAESTTAFEPPDRTVSFDISSGGNDWYVLYFAPIDLPDNTERGTLVFTPIETPEPRSLVLVFVGIGALLVLKNRLG